MQKKTTFKNIDDLQKREKQLADAIINYLSEHPQASDTLEGIAEWWVMRQQVRAEVSAITNVLRQLTNSGLLEKIGDGKQAQYHLKKQKKTST